MRGTFARVRLTMLRRCIEELQEPSRRTFGLFFVIDEDLNKIVSVEIHRACTDISYSPALDPDAACMTWQTVSVLLEYSFAFAALRAWKECQ